MFRKIIMALTATTLVASPVISAQAQAAPNQYRAEQSRTVIKHRANGRTVVKKHTVLRKDTRRYAQHRWTRGQRFDRRQASHYRVVNNYRDYRLSAPPRGYQWVRSGNDAVMIAIASGIIGAVVGGVIR